MPRTLTQEQFIQRARQIHGERYDYSSVVYTTSDAKVVVRCPRHELFGVTPSNHTRGRGCPKCGRERQTASYRKDTPTFIKEASAKHGDRYDYGRVDYRQARAKVEITCQEHGSFWQTPDSHLRGNGCPKCRDRLTSERFKWDSLEFVRHATNKFGDRFDYSRLEYKTAWDPVLITCPEHGAFEQTPVAHLVGVHGCPQCAHAKVNAHRRLNKSDFLRRAREIHGDRYDYAQVQCADSKSKVTIVCRKHGAFTQVAMNHLSGRGCKACGNELISLKQRQDPAEFVRRAKEVHGDRYNYTQVDYVSARRKVAIVCPIHGVFEQTPDSHLSGGCRQCANEELPGAYSLKVLMRNPVLAGKPSILYYIKFDAESGEMFYKVGVTTTSVIKRFAGYAAAGYRVKKIREIKLPLLEAFNREQYLLKNHCERFKHRPLKGNRKGFVFGGGSECFSAPLPRALLSIFTARRK